jgi:hypothetical protein
MATGDTCTIGARHDAEIRALEKTTAELGATDKDLWTAVNLLRNRLPTWATVTIALLMGVIGWLAAVAKAHGG